MQFKIRQLSDLVDGNLVGERDYTVATPEDINGVLFAMLEACSDYLRSESISITQTSIELQKVVFTYPGLAGAIELEIGTTTAE